MSIVSPFWVFLFAALFAGAVLGILLTRLMSNRNAHYNDVRWKRSYNEMLAEHELSINKLKKTLRHSQDKQANLRQALHESDETLQLLSADDSSMQKQELAERNLRIADLEKKLSHTRARLADADDQEATLEKKLAGLESKLAEVEAHAAELEMLNAEMKPAHQAQLDQQERYANLQIGLEAAQNKLAQRNKEVADMTRHLKKYESEAPNYQHQITQRDSRLASLSEQFEEMRQQLPSLNDALREREASINDLLAELSQERRKSEALEEKLTDIHAAKVDDPPRHFDARVVSIHQLAQTDDLQRIRGIGPVLESALNTLGFSKFEQLARMNDQDIEKLARHDSSLPGRIRRYKWVEQAKKLQDLHEPDRQRPSA